MRPLYSIVIPCYNGVKFMDMAFHSLINERIMEQDLTHMYEIIFIDDGSTDDSLAMARGYAKTWNKKVRKDFIRVIKKKNGQYGSVINKGLELANGFYFKVLDVDDTFNISSFIKLLYITNGLKKHVDMILTDHIFDKVGSNKQELLSLRDAFEPNVVLNTKKTDFPNSLITMHSVIYRTDLLRDINYKQLEGVYYSDSQYSLVPLKSVKTLYYAELPLYRYYIGRNEQSINMEVMVRNSSHQGAVRRIIFEEIDFTKIKSSGLRKYTARSMKNMIEWSILIISYDKSIKNKAKAVLEIIEESKRLQPKHYKMIMKGPLFVYIKITRAKMIAPFLKIAIKIYMKFKKNILAEWDD